MKQRKKGLVFFLAWLMFLIIGLIILFFVIKVGVEIGGEFLGIQGASALSFHGLMEKLNGLEAGASNSHVLVLKKDSGVIFFNKGYSFVSMTVDQEPGARAALSLTDYLKPKWVFFLRPDQGECSDVNKNCACFVSKISLEENPGFQEVHGSEMIFQDVVINIPSAFKSYAFKKYDCVESDFYFAETQPMSISLNPSPYSTQEQEGINQPYYKSRPFIGGTAVYRSKNSEGVERSNLLFMERYSNTVRLCTELPCFEEWEKQLMQYFKEHVKNLYDSCRSYGADNCGIAKDNKIDDVLVSAAVLRNIIELKQNGLAHAGVIELKEIQDSYGIRYRSFYKSNAESIDKEYDPVVELVVDYGYPRFGSSNAERYATLNSNVYLKTVSPGSYTYISSRSIDYYTRISPEFVLEVPACVNENENSNKWLFKIKLDEQRVFALTFEDVYENDAWKPEGKRYSACFNLWYSPAAIECPNDSGQVRQTKVPYGPLEYENCFENLFFRQDGEFKSSDEINEISTKKRFQAD